ncbi:MAG: beta strand repeat-containing protein [Opitutaceae bacterium]
MDKSQNTTFDKNVNFRFNKHLALGLSCLLSLSAVGNAAITATGDTSPAPGDGFWGAGGDPVDSYTNIAIGDTTVSGGSVTGSLTVDGGSTLDTGEGVIGSDAGTYGAATVSGLGSTWKVNKDPSDEVSDWAIVVGSDGKGELTIESSAAVTALNMFIADSTTGDGTVLVDSSATLAVGEDIEVGYENTASMTVKDSAVVDTYSLTVGVESTANGILTVTDDGTLNANVEQVGVTYADPAKFIVGEFGTGTMNVTDGGVVNSGAASIGLESGSTGTVTVGGSGAAASWNVAGDLGIGAEGTGTLTLAADGTVDVDGATELSADGGMGSVVFSGGTLNTGTLGADVSDLSGTGTINTSGLAGLLSKVTFTSDNMYSETLTSGGPTSVAVNVTADGNGSLYNVDFDAIGPSGGQDPIPVVVAFENVGLGDGVGITNSGLVDSSLVTFAVSGDLDVGFEGTGDLTVSNGAAVTADGVSIGAESTGIGTVTVSGLGSSMILADTLYVGESGEGDLEINTLAAVSANTVHIGKNDSSSGEILVDAATLNVTGDLTLGLSGNGYGGLEISNAGVVSVGGTTQAVNGTIGFGAGDNGVLNTGNLVLNDIDDLEGTGTINTNGINQFNGGIITAIFDGDNANEQLYSQNLATSYEVEGSPGTFVNGTVAVNLTANGDGDLTDVNLVVRDGANVSFNHVDLGNSSSPNNSALVTGGSQLNVIETSIGVNGDAILTVDQGSYLNAFGAGDGQNTDGLITLGESVGNSGTLLVQNDSWVGVDILEVGEFGSGYVEISGGSSVASKRHVEIGSDGSVLVTGLWSELSATGAIGITVADQGLLQVRNFGVVNVIQGSRLTVNDGAEVRLSNGTINTHTLESSDLGAFTGSGTINADGIVDLFDTITFDGTNTFNTTLAGGDIDLNVTASGAGHFDVEEINIINGADTRAASVRVDRLLIEGAGSRLGSLSLGTGTVRTLQELDINGGAQLELGSLYIHSGYGVVEGAGSRIDLLGPFWVGVGSNPTAELFIEDGAAVTAGVVVINNAAGTGEVEVEVVDAGTSLSAMGSIIIGPNGGTADLNIRGGATVSAGDDIVIGTDAVVNLTVYGDNQLNAGTDGDGGIQNDGVVNIFAYADLAAGVYTPVTVGSSTGAIAGSGDYNAFGGTFNVATGTFTVSALVDGSAGFTNQDLSGLRANFDSGDLVVNFAEGADSSASFSAMEITDVSSIGGFGALQVYGFTTDMVFGVDEQVLLSFFVGEGLDGETFEFWHRATAGSEWTLLDPDVASYVDGWVNFTVTGFSDYAITVPEPQTYALIFGACALGLAMIRRRR